LKGEGRVSGRDLERQKKHEKKDERVGFDPAGRAGAAVDRVREGEKG
jgi:hypothetical protein